MPLTADQVLAYVKTHSPCVPNEIRQALKAQDNFVVGAILSELANAGKLKITTLSLGTSKFYYDPEQPQSLERVSQHLNEKDQRAYAHLKEQQVVFVDELTPILRVAMSNIPDYAASIRVRTDNGDMLFWRYYLLSDEAAFELIKERYFPEKKQETPPASSPPAPPSEPAVAPAVAPTSVKTKRAPRKTTPKTAQSTLAPTSATTSSEQKTLALTDEWTKQVHDYFDSKQIALLQVIAAKKTELSLVISVPSAVGTVTYFCKARAKKSTSDGDLASALLEAQEHKLPLLYVAGGTLTKKATELLSTSLRGVVVVQPWA